MPNVIIEGENIATIPDSIEMGPNLANSNETNQGVRLRNQESEISYYKMANGINVWLGRIVLGTFYISGIFACLFYQKFISNVSIAFYNIFQNDEMYDKIYAGIVGGHALILLLVSQIQNLPKNWFEYLSVGCMSLISICLCMVTAVFNDFKHEDELSLAGTGIFTPMVIFLFAMSCQDFFIEIFAKLRTKTKKALVIIAGVASISSASIYGIICIVVYALFGNNNLNGDIINGLLYHKSHLRNFISSTHPNFFFIPYLLGSAVIAQLTIISVFQMASLSQITRLIMRRFRIADGIIVFASTLVTILLVSLINIFGKVSLVTVVMLIGNFVCIPMVLIFPFVFAYFYLGKNSRLIRTFSIILIILGIILFILNTVFYFAPIETFINNCIDETVEMMNETTTTTSSSIPTGYFINSTHGEAIGMMDTTQTTPSSSIPTRDLLNSTSGEAVGMINETMTTAYNFDPNEDLLTNTNDTSNGFNEPITSVTHAVPTETLMDNTTDETNGKFNETIFSPSTFGQNEDLMNYTTDKPVEVLNETMMAGSHSVTTVNFLNTTVHETLGNINETIPKIGIVIRRRVLKNSTIDKGWHT